MLNAADPSLPIIPTEQIQKYLEENKELIMAVLECQNQGKFGEIAQYQARLQHNLTFLAKLADVDAQAQTHSQGQGMQQSHVAMSQQQQGQGMQPHPHVAMFQQQPDHSTLNLPMGMNDEQQQQRQHQHLAISLQQPGLSVSNLPFQMNEQQHKLPAFFHQQLQLVPGTMDDYPGTSNGMYQGPGWS